MAAKGGSLDFGNLRVGDTKPETFSLKNKGKYDIDFAFVIRRAAVAEIFTIEPASGTIPPDGNVDITVTFCSVREVTLKDNKLTVVLNGQKVQDELDLVGKKRPNKKLAEKGKIAIQDHGQPFWVRNIKVKAH